MYASYSRTFRELWQVVFNLDSIYYPGYFWKINHWTFLNVPVVRCYWVFCHDMQVLVSKISSDFNPIYKIPNCILGFTQFVLLALIYGIKWLVNITRKRTFVAMCSSRLSRRDYNLCLISKKVRSDLFAAENIPRATAS